MRQKQKSDDAAIKLQDEIHRIKSQKVFYFLAVISIRDSLHVCSLHVCLTYANLILFYFSGAITAKD